MASVPLLNRDDDCNQPDMGWLGVIIWERDWRQGGLVRGTEVLRQEDNMHSIETRPPQKPLYCFGILTKKMNFLSLEVHFPSFIFPFRKTMEEAQRFIFFMVWSAGKLGNAENRLVWLLRREKGLQRPVGTILPRNTFAFSKNRAILRQTGFPGG